MSDEVKSAKISQVVVLSRDPSLAGTELRELCASGIRCLRLTSPYEAAAEVLAGEVGAIVLDLRVLTARNLRLLDLARQRRVEVLAVGSMSAGLSAENLSGVRLVAMRDLADVLRGLLSAEQFAASAEAPPAETGPAPKKTPLKKSHAKSPAEGQGKAPIELPSKIAAEPGGNAPPQIEEGVFEIEAAAQDETKDISPADADKTLPPPTPSSLLTPEELAALLENEP